MKICAISDTHCEQPDLPDADLLIHAGDIGSRGGYPEIMQQIDWLESLKPRFPRGIIYVPGNHDKALDPELYEKRLAEWVADPYHTYKPNILGGANKIAQDIRDTGITLLMDKAIEIEGIKIYGSPYTPIFFDWAFMESESDLANRFQKIPDDTQLLITHGPAQRMRDLCRNGHVGSSALRYVLDSRLPDLKAHIFGHIHESAGHNQEGRFQCWNAAVLDGKYHGFNQIFTMDTDDWTIS